MTADILTLASGATGERIALSPAEAELLARAETARFRAVERGAPMLASLKARIDRLDSAIADRAETVRRLRTYASSTGLDGWAPPIPGWIFWPVMLVMLLLEIPVNAAALDLLRLPVLESYMLAGFFAIASLLGAKSTARAIRQWRAEDHGRRDLIVAIAVNAVLLVGLALMARLRAEASGEGAATLAFLALQLLFYAVAFVLAWLNTCPDAEAEQEMKRLRHAERALGRAARARTRLVARHNAGLQRLEARLGTIEQDCARRIHRLRARAARGGIAVAQLQPIDPSTFQRLGLGQPIRPEPIVLNAASAN
ncbi:MAG: hypothetical protein ACK4Z0_05850 [Sphingomonadaceae bacterium]